MIPVPDIGHVYPKSGLDADLRFDSTPTYVSTGSMFLDGVNDHLDLDGLTLTTSSANYSFSFWFRTVDKTSDHRFFGIQNSGNSDRLNVQITATDIFSYSLVSAGGTSTTFSTSFVNDFENGSWHHAAMVVTSGTGVVLYLDGQLVTASQTMRNVDLSANGLFAVGSDYDGSAGGTLSGCICHFGVWHAALTQAQVKDLMTATTYAEAVTKGGSTPRAYFLLESNATDSVGAITYTTSGSTSGTLTSGAAIVGDRARLPSGLDLTGNQMNAQVFSGRAVAFDGTGGSANDQLLADSYADSSDYFSLSIWFKASAAGLSKGLWTNGPAAEDVEHGLVWFQAGLLRYHYQDGTAQYLMASDYNPDPGIWHHLVATVDGSTASAYDVKIYLDGKLQSASKTTSGATWHASDGLTIGSQYGHAGYWDGSISDCRMFNVELTAAQALELYQNPEQVLPTGVSASALKRFYPLCDYDISGAESLDGLYLQDSSGNGKHLLATGTAMEFAQPTCPQLGLRSSASMCLFNDSNTVTRLNADAAFNCSGAFTYLFWFQTFTANADARLLDANAGAGPVVWIDSADAGYVRVRTQLFFGGSGHTWDTPNNVVPIGEWVHLGVTFAGGDSSEIVYYVNGSSVAVTNPGGTPSGTQGADSGIKDIGGSGSGVVWDGFISEFAIFAGTVLDADAVAAVYQSGIQGFDLLTDSSNYDNSGDLDGWWKIDNPQTNVDLKGSVDATWNNTLTRLRAGSELHRARIMGRGLSQSRFGLDPPKVQR